MVAAFAPFSPQVEALRTLRSELLLRWFNGDNKQLAILGLEHGGGCSYLGANLAIVFSQMGEKTLLIDANLRQPKLHQFFNISAGKGLSDLLVGRLEMDKTIHKIPDFIDLSVLPAGTVPPNPQELLAKASFKVLLRELAQEYDIILIDTPNAALYADMKHVVSETKGALLVARKHHTSFRSVQTLQQQLINANVQLIGTVLNEF
jgi:chain length determinant protein tyrosine kinase EpsG